MISADINETARVTSLQLSGNIAKDKKEKDLKCACEKLNGMKDQNLKYFLNMLKYAIYNIFYNSTKYK